LTARLAARWFDKNDEVSPHYGLGMLCHAGIAIGLADFVGSAWLTPMDGGFVTHPVATHFNTVVLGSVVIFELLGPLVLKSVTKSAGEVKAITLLRRRKAAPAEGDSITRLTWEALKRTFGLSGKRKQDTSVDPRVRHIMRSNIRFIRDSAKLDEVLHFVEASRYNHFPVVDGQDRFVGMIHFADLRDMLYDPHMRELVTAVDLASPDDMVPADMPLDELLERFKKSDVGSLVVVESEETRQVVGLVEQRDLLQALHQDSKT
jgi:CBS domain-containing protein